MRKILKKVRAIFDFDLFISWLISLIITNLLFISSSWVNQNLSFLGLLYQLIITMSLLLLFFTELKRKKTDVFLFLIFYSIIGLLTGFILSLIKYFEFQYFDLLLIIIFGFVGLLTPLWGNFCLKLYQLLKDYL